MLWPVTVFSRLWHRKKHKFLPKTTGSVHVPLTQSPAPFPAPYSISCLLLPMHKVAGGRRSCRIYEVLSASSMALRWHFISGQRGVQFECGRYLFTSIKLKKEHFYPLPGCDFYLLVSTNHKHWKVWAIFLKTFFLLLFYFIQVLSSYCQPALNHNCIHNDTFCLFPSSPVLFF